MLDVGIIGAGPAGLSAALILGRCRRAVVVFDSGKPRNAASRGLHGFLSRDGTHPLHLRELGRTEIARYPTVRVRDVAVAAVRRHDAHFELVLADGSAARARILLLATGRVDVLPEKPGFRELYGRGVYHCPICDGWEHRDQPFVAYGRGREAAAIALELLRWTGRVALCTDGEGPLDDATRARLARNRVEVIETTVATLRAGGDGMLAHMVFADGTHRECGALFLDAAAPQRSSLAENLGAELDRSGGIRCNQHAATNVPGVFVAGNVRCGIHLAITAAAEGVEAALAINDALLERELA
jgi:thioredoxin reductase